MISAIVIVVRNSKSVVIKGKNVAKKTGRTAFEILKDQFTTKKPEVPVESLYYNPLEAKIGSSAVFSNHLEYDRFPWKVTEIWNWDRSINGNSHKFADYVLEHEQKRLVLRVMKNKTEHELLLMTQFWPENSLLPHQWDEEVVGLIDALYDPTGELVYNADQVNEERYFRDIVGVHVTVDIISDANLDGKATTDEVVKSIPYTLWTFYRNAVDEGGTEFTQLLHVQLSGHYNRSTKKVNGGDKCVSILRGESLLPLNVKLY